MKKSIYSIILVFVTLLNFAQSSEHLLFKGVPIDGTLLQYINKMKENGLSLIQSKDGTAFLKGDFAGYKDCIVGVSTLNQKDLVHKIGVVFPDNDSWSSLSNYYFNIKDLLIEKYGEPTNVVEKFDEETDDDNMKFLKVKLDNCTYFSTWQTDKGDIQLSIKHSSFSSCFIKLTYFDKINGEKIKAKAKSDL